MTFEEWYGIFAKAYVEQEEFDYEMKAILETCWNDAVLEGRNIQAFKDHADMQQDAIDYEDWNFNPMTGKPIWGEEAEPVQNPVAEYALSAARQLLDYADESDGCQYGTLSTSLVRDAMEQILPALIAAPVDAKAIREQALEEAAKWLKESGLIGSNDCAAVIRRLK